MAAGFAGVYHQFDKRLLGNEIGAGESYWKALVLASNLLLTVGIFDDQDLPISRHWLGVTTLSLGCILSMTFSVYVLGLLFQRLSSGKRRGKSLLFSKFAVVKQTSHFEFALEFAVVEARRHQLIGAAVTVYAFNHDSLTMQRLHLKRPTGGALFPALPNNVQICIDRTSPLWPGLWKCSQLSCDVCGFEVETEAEISAHEHTFPGHLCRRETATLGAAVNHILKFEIMAVVEGAEPVTGAPVRACHSFFGPDEVRAAGDWPQWGRHLPHGEVQVDFAPFAH